MTKRQASTLMAVLLAILLTQILCTAVVLCGLDRMRKEASAQASAMDVLGMQMQTKLVELYDVRVRNVVPADVSTTQAKHRTTATATNVLPFVGCEVEPIRLPSKYSESKVGVQR